MANIVRSGFYPAVFGGARTVVWWFPITTGNGATIFVGDVVRNQADGGVIRAAADSGTAQVGVVVGLYDTNKIPIGAPGAAVTTKYMPASTAGFAAVALALPSAIFIGYAGSNANFSAVTDIFASADHVNTAGSTTTAVSGHVLNGSILNTEANFQVLGIVDEPANAWGANVALYVRFLESMWGQVNPSAGV